jgi:hypothetical protein
MISCPGRTNASVIAILAASFLLSISCGDKATEEQGEFDLYGRIVYRSLLFGSSAEFFVYSQGLPVTDALITVESDTVPLVNGDEGYYYAPLDIFIGDTLSYSVVSASGSSAGDVVIPDTTSIVSPDEGDTLITGFDFSVVWRRTTGADGYFISLENQAGLVAEVVESYFDSSVVVTGENLFITGVDNLWVEVLSGNVSSGVTPFGRRLPWGVFGSAGSIREVFVDTGPLNAD